VACHRYERITTNRGDLLVNYSDGIIVAMEDLKEGLGETGRVNSSIITNTHLPKSH
jgi:hypothetical protein